MKIWANYRILGPMFAVFMFSFSAFICYPFWKFSCSNSQDLTVWTLKMRGFHSIWMQSCYIWHGIRQQTWLLVLLQTACICAMSSSSPHLQFLQIPYVMSADYRRFVGVFNDIQRGCNEAKGKEENNTEERTPLVWWWGLRMSIKGWMYPRERERTLQMSWEIPSNKSSYFLLFISNIICPFL